MVQERVLKTSSRLRCLLCTTVTGRAVRRLDWNYALSVIGDGQQTMCGLGVNPIFFRTCVHEKNVNQPGQSVWDRVIIFLCGGCWVCLSSLSQGHTSAFSRRASRSVATSLAKSSDVASRLHVPGRSTTDSHRHSSWRLHCRTLRSSWVR